MHDTWCLPTTSLTHRMLPATIRLPMHTTPQLQLLHAMLGTRYTTSCCACSSSHISHHMASISLPPLPPLVSALNLPVFSSPTTGSYVSIVSPHTTHSSNPNPITNCSHEAPCPYSQQLRTHPQGSQPHLSLTPLGAFLYLKALKENCHMRLH